MQMGFRWDFHNQISSFESIKALNTILAEVLNQYILILDNLFFFD